MSDDALNSTILVTTADAAHFDLALELIGSVRSHSELAPVKLGLLDVGLSQAQRDLIITQGVIIAPARWEFDGEPPPEMPTGNLAMLARPFLPKYFPTFDLLAYLDSDTWVQMAAGITDLVAAARQTDLAAAPELHPSYEHLFNPQHPNRNEHRGAYIAVYGRQTLNPADNWVLSSGVFAARRDSRMWSDWAASLHLGLNRVRNGLLPDGKPLFSVWHPVNHFIEQNALNHAFHQKGFTLHPMSSLYNFVCTLSRPLFDPESRKLVEPTCPYAPIRIVHLTRAGKEATKVLDRHGHLHERGLRWSDWRDIIAAG